MRPDEQPDQGLEEIMATFERHEVDYVVIGGEAARARGWPEQTEDVDVTPERSKENLSRLADALEELEAGFRVDPVRYPEGFRPPGGIDWRTFRSQVWVTLTTRHGDIDVVLTPTARTVMRRSPRPRHASGWRAPRSSSRSPRQR